MSRVIAGFTDYDDQGKPYMGIIVEDSTLQVKVYLAHKDEAMKVAAAIGRQLNEMALELTKMPNKIMPVEGVIANGGIVRGKS